MSRSIKQFYEIIWILVQVLILFIFSKYFGFKDRSDSFKTMYVLISLIITIYQWLEKENFFRLLIDKVFYEMGKKSREIIKKIIKEDYVVPFYSISLFFELSLFYSSLNKLYIKCKNCISNLRELKGKGYILVFLDFVGFLIGLFSDMLKALYLYFSIIILIKLFIGRDLAGFLSIVILYYIYILALVRAAGKRQQNFIVCVVILIAVIIINISDFEEFISPIVVLIVIPFINWYYSETRQLISDAEKFKEPDIETKKTWAKIKSVTVFLSISVSIVVIMKKLLSTNNKKETLENNNISLIEDAFGIGKISPSMLLSVATGLIFLILWCAVPWGVKYGPGFIDKYTKNKEKLKKRISIKR